MLGAWAGEMAGVAWAASTEFKHHGYIMPDDQVPEWQPEMINAGYLQDDLYVEIPFLVTLANHGPLASWSDFADSFRDTTFPLWHANDAGRRNIQAGVPAPLSGNYANNQHCEDLDWQIEADFAGILCPGRPNEAVDIAWRAGHVMTYGDGTLGGVFIAAMHAASYFASSLEEIVDAGEASLPEGSKYRQVVEDVRAWHAAALPWEDAWQQLQDKWGSDDRCPSYDMPFMQSYDIDAKLNGAYVLIGLLYGEGDIEKSMRIAMRCGQDSDCNPSSVGGILGNWLGFAALPEQFRSALDKGRAFLFTDISLQDALNVSKAIAARIVVMSGGDIRSEGGSEIWDIPMDSAVLPPVLEQWPAQANTPPALSAWIVVQSGRTVEFASDAEDVDGIAGYEWHFGDLKRAAGAIASHTYDGPGDYEVTAYAADSLGNTSWAVIPVTIP